MKMKSELAEEGDFTAVQIKEVTWISVYMEDGVDSNNLALLLTELGNAKIVVGGDLNAVTEKWGSVPTKGYIGRKRRGM